MEQSAVKNQEVEMTVYDYLSRVLAYPFVGMRQLAEQGESILISSYPEEIENWQKFVSSIALLDQGEWEELYVATFDVQAACCLDIGYVLYGEDYKRGQFMANLKEACRTLHVDIGTELPDHLPNILRLLPKLKFGDGANLVNGVVAPAMDKMLGGFEKSENPYRWIIAIVRQVLRKDYQMQ